MLASQRRGADVPAPTAEELQKLVDFLYRKTGMLFDPSRSLFLEKRVQDRIAEGDCEGFAEWFGRVRFDLGGVECQALINATTVNETHFYREEYQFRCMVASILPEIATRKAVGERIRIWSLPCATGEEPYSIGMYLLDHWADADRFDIEITGSDIDTDALRCARDGRYDARSLQYLPPAAVARYFRLVAPGTWQLCDALRTSVDFTTANLAEPSISSAGPVHDLIFCRNLLIYFDDVSRRRAAEALFDCLRPGGFLCLGHSESMSRISPIFGVRVFKDAIVYQKPL
jgi:chemotaxis protein methyltransferase CheR